MHVRISKYGVSNRVAEQRLDRSSSHRRHIQLLEYQHVRRSRLDSMFYTSFHSLPPPTLQGHVRGAMRYRRECQQVIDKAYATKCNRSEESRASRIAARRRGQPFKSYHYTWLFISDFEGFGHVRFVQNYSSMACVASRYTAAESRSADEVERPTVTLLSWRKY